MWSLESYYAHSCIASLQWFEQDYSELLEREKILTFKTVLRSLKRTLLVVPGFAIFNLLGNGTKSWRRIAHLVETVHGNWSETKFGFSISGSRAVNWFLCVNCKYWEKIRLTKTEFLYDRIKKIFPIHNFNIKKKVKNFIDMWFINRTRLVLI